MQVLRRALLIWFTIFALTGVAGATPLQGLSDAATLITGSSAAKLHRPQIEHAWWYFYHRRYHHYHHWQHNYSYRHTDPDHDQPTQDHHWWDD